MTLDLEVFRARLGQPELDCIAENAPGFPADQDLLMLARFEYGEFSDELRQLASERWDWMDSCDGSRPYEDATVAALSGEFPQQTAPFGLGDLPDFPSISTESLEHLLDEYLQAFAEMAPELTVVEMFDALPVVYGDRQLLDAYKPSYHVYEFMEIGSLTGVGTQWTPWLHADMKHSRFSAREALYVYALTLWDQGVKPVTGVDGDYAWMISDFPYNSSPVPYRKELAWHRRGDSAVIAVVGANDAELEDMVRLLSESIVTSFPGY
ncbi:MAG: hypothetical protein QF357_03375 [Dehalococcoidia bacterium]|nr:hypothetical protein [Dehalococcoidia bacterium]